MYLPGATSVLHLRLSCAPLLRPLFVILSFLFISISLFSPKHSLVLLTPYACPHVLWFFATSLLITMAEVRRARRSRA